MMRSSPPPVLARCIYWFLILTQLANLVRVEWVMPVYGSLRLSARERDERSFEAMFKRHYAPLLSYCRHMLGDRDEAEDALQQAFIRAHRAMFDGTKPREVRPWLYAIARNCCLSAIAARRPTTPLQDHTPALAGLSEQVHRREDLRELVAGIARLPEDQRSALLLAELEDLTHREIAGIVGCPVSRVKALIYQARSALIADRDALGTPCQDIREQLAVARGGELRRGPLRRHLNLCAGCRDFQLAVGAQRQSLAAVLPVLPSAGLATAILGHAAAHTVGTAAGGAGISASGAAATSTAVGAGAGTGGGTGIGTLLGGGVVSKLAVGGTIAVLATAGAVAIRHPAHADQRSSQSGPRHGALRRGAPATTAQEGAPMLNAAFVQADGGSSQAGAASSEPGASGLGPGASSLGASASALGGTGGSAVAALSLGIAGTVTMPLAEAAPAGPVQPARPGGSAGVSGKTSNTNRRHAISKMRRAAQRRLHGRRLRARRRLLKLHRALKRRQAPERHRQLQRRQIAKRRSKRVAIPPHPPVATPTAPTPARPPHRHKPRITTTTTSETSSSSTTTGAPAPKTSGRRRSHGTADPSTGEAEAGASGTSSTTSGSASSEHANNGKPSGASDPGTGAQACGAEATNRANATVQPRGHADGHTHTCPAAQQEEA
jgi:RNA polymerase sigma factor (sigma-70 family)